MLDGEHPLRVHLEFVPRAAFPDVLDDFLPLLAVHRGGGIDVGSDLQFKEPRQFAAQFRGSGIHDETFVAQKPDGRHDPAPAVLARGHHDGNIVGEIPRGITPDLGRMRLHEGQKRSELGELHIPPLLLQPVGAEPDDLGGDRPEAPQRRERPLRQHRGGLGPFRGKEKLSGDRKSQQNGKQNYRPEIFHWLRGIL